MDQTFFIAFIAVLIAVAIAWGGRILPREKWQILATLPLEKGDNGRWKGLNLTYYGLFSANAYTFAVVIFFILGASADIPAQKLCIFILALLGVCMPAAKIVARIVEKKRGTLTVGGAVFVGTLVAPWLICLMNLIPGHAPGHALGQTQGGQMKVTILLSAICVSYAYGEGLGRLACISFGCCYGKPIHLCSPWVQKLFGHFYLVFTGATKKIAYASGLEGERIIPIQIITAILYSISALVGTGLYLNGYFATAFMETLVVTQVWRIASEFFRADFRGGFKITPYQLMAAGALVYSLGIVLVFPAQESVVRLGLGLRELWTPWMLVFVESIWIMTFVYTGRSTVTGAQISFHVEKGKI
ncbi:conserved hypothetical protein [Desulforapulum autotrophicum HRM2]|uniref:Prolipoprotein diacylglyceryl transferase n=1 Tax=Desulforapulum autotrophicum (strain ATCC 43914 / DSM 3382 / VKM B-1955 / HRM2) TaxID=177437 RepID=C0QF58_DESAH|nr:hypothetical protein [Desulforapulum autotrophicum]ACN17559.1 conserved hypothetical protein [Desulforapulum autotrophicum HRM2]